MSNIIVPFDGEPAQGGEVTPFVPLSPVSTDIFKPELSDFNFRAYGARQKRIDTLLQAGDPLAINQLLREFDGKDQDLGIKLNNLHNTVVEGETIRGLNAPLAVFSATRFETSMPSLNFNGGVGAEVVFNGEKMQTGDYTSAVIPRADFSGVDLRGSRFTNAIVNEGDFTNTLLTGTDFSGAWLLNPKGLTREQIDDMNLRGARVIFSGQEGDSEGRTINDLLSGWFSNPKDENDFRKQLSTVPVAINERLGKLQAGRILRGLYALNIKGSGTSLTGSDITGAVINGWSDSNASLHSAFIGGSIITNAMLPGLDMEQTWAPGIILEGVNMPDSSLKGANIVGAVLRDVDLSRATGLNEANTNGIVIENSRLPQGYGYDGVAIQMTAKLKQQLGK